MERFFSKVKKTNSCWIWIADKFNNGYGRFKFKIDNKFKSCGAHRVSWRLHNGEIPKGMSVCHTCDIPLCVNPEHLFLGTALDNALDKVSKNRQRNGNINKKFCKNGHKLNKANTYVYPNRIRRKRKCLVCAYNYRKNRSVSSVG